MSLLTGIKVNQVYRGTSGQLYVIDGFYNRESKVSYSNYEDRSVKWGSVKSDFTDPSLFKLQPSLSKLQNWYANLTVDAKFFPIINLAHGKVYLEALRERHATVQISQGHFDKFISTLEDEQRIPQWKDVPPFFPAIAQYKIDFSGGEEPNAAPQPVLSVEIIGSIAELSKVISQGKLADTLYREPSSMINHL